MRKIVPMILSLLFFTLIHEGFHILVALIIGEYEGFHIKPIGFEVLTKTPVNQRQGIQWAFFSGVSNLVTILIGYILFAFSKKFARINVTIVRNTSYFSTVFFLSLDPLNLSIGPFIYGGDIFGIATGLNIHPYWLQMFFFGIFLIHRELIAQQVLPSYGVNANLFLWRPWLPKKLFQNHCFQIKD